MSLFGSLKELVGLRREYSLCMLVSEQEGAEIWVNGKNSGRVTPALLPLPRFREVMVELRHPAHENHRAWLKSAHERSFYYCDLKRIPLRLVSDDESEIVPVPRNQTPVYPAYEGPGF